MEHSPWGQQPNEARPGYQQSWPGSAPRRSQRAPKRCRLDASSVPGRRSVPDRQRAARWQCACHRRQLTLTAHTHRGRPRRIDAAARRAPAGRRGRPRRPPLQVRNLSGILGITATAHTLRAVICDPAVRRWIQLDYRGKPGARCLIDGRPASADPPRDAADALRLVATLLRARGVAVTAVALLVKLDHGVAFAPALAALDAARIAWPDVPHLACLGTQPDVEAVIDEQFRALLRGSDGRAERILDYPCGHFARARDRARAELTE
jgi:hypothetical protein